MFSCVLILMLSLFVPSSLESLQYKAVILSLFSFALFISSSLMKRDFLNSYYTIFPFPFPVSRPRQHGHLKRKDSIRFLVFLDFSLIFIRSG